MFPSKRFRLLACIALMLGFMVAGSFARIRWGVSTAPFGWNDMTSDSPSPRRATPFDDLRRPYRVGPTYPTYSNPR